MTASTNEEDSVVSNDYATAIGTLILTLVFLLGVPGNLFIVWSILARTRKRSVTTILILNLACADGFIMALTIFFIIYLAKQTWIFGLVMCKGVFYLCNANMYASIFLITLMSAHRWWRCVSAETTLISRQVVTRVIMGMWVLVMTISIPSLVFRELEIEPDLSQNDSRIVCSPNHTWPTHVRFQYSLETVSGFILPYAAIITCYVLTLRRLRQTQFQRRIRSEKLILAIVITFGMFWFPYHVINMVQVAAEWYSKETRTRKILELIHENCRAVTSALAFLSSCANPILYTFAGKSYIKKNGLAFMAKLFDGTASSDQTANKQNRIESGGEMNNILLNTNTT
ncbi:leukotriene B4 receptor 1-like [Poeciliopsis prolifica]|uniref:leukotriene B4 receptor 1-like n=1 Tax=Poeciliopsis prolifica TaxID=188132 RepID=UPI00241413D4|nr:leukotriene B4 receptor 1-like [Poeciliopsis prolifica]